jgi:hypothetical protein
VSGVGVRYNGTGLAFSGPDVAYIQSLLLPIPASAIVPGTFAPGSYAFPGAIHALEVFSQAGGAVPGIVPPLYTPGGGTFANTAHMVAANTNIAVPNTATSASVTITLTGSAVFASSASYAVVATIDNALSAPGSWTYPSTELVVTYTSGSSFTITAWSSITSTSSGTIPVSWLAIGS